MKNYDYKLITRYIYHEKGYPIYVNEISIRDEEYLDIFYLNIQRDTNEYLLLSLSKLDDFIIENRNILISDIISE